MVVEEQRLTAIHCLDLSQLVLGQLEVEDVEVFAHALRPHGLLDDDNAALDEPTQHN